MLPACCVLKKKKEKKKKETRRLHFPFEKRGKSVFDLFDSQRQEKKKGGKINSFFPYFLSKPLARSPARLLYRARERATKAFSFSADEEKYLLYIAFTSTFHLRLHDLCTLFPTFFHGRCQLDPLRHFSLLRISF